MLTTEVPHAICFIILCYYEYCSNINLKKLCKFLVYKMSAVSVKDFSFETVLPVR